MPEELVAVGATGKNKIILRCKKDEKAVVPEMTCDVIAVYDEDAQRIFGFKKKEKIGENTF